MKLFKGHFFLGLIMTAICVAGCSNDDFQEAQKPEVITITADAPNQEATRVNFGKENFVISWKAGDAFQVYSNGTAGNKFDFESKDAQGRGQFKGTKPSASGNMFAYYPAAKSQNTGRDNDLFDYTGQVQAGNDNVDGLSDYLYMLGDVDPVDYSVSNFVLQPAILKMTINMPADFEGAVSSVAIDFANTKFHKRKHVQASLDVEADDGLSMSMSLTDVSLTTGEQLVVYMAMSPMQVTDDTFTLTVTAGGVQYVSTIENFTYDFVQAKVCPAVLTVESQATEISLLAMHQQVSGLAVDATQEVSNTIVRGVVVSKDNYGVYISDGTAGIYCYKASDFAIDDEIQVVPSSIKNYKGLMEVYSGVYTKVAEPTLTLESVLTDATIADINAAIAATPRDNHFQGMYVRLTGVKSDNTDWTTSPTLTMGEATLVTGSNAALDKLGSTDYTFDALCVVECANNNHYLSVQVVENIVKPAGFSLSADKTEGIAADGSFKPTITVLEEGEVEWTAEIDNAAASLDVNKETNTIVVTLPANETDSPVVYTVTVTSADGTIVRTIELTQSAPIAQVTMLDLRAKGAGLANYATKPIESTMLNAVVTHTNNDGVYFADETAAIFWYSPEGGASSYTVGDVYEITPTELKNYRGQLEITKGTSTLLENSSMSLESIIADATIAEIKADQDRYRRMQVRLTGVTADKTSWSSNPTLSQNGSSISTTSNASNLVDLKSTASVFDITAEVAGSTSELEVLTVSNEQVPDYINLTADKSSSLLADGSEDPIITVDANVSWASEVSGDATITSLDATTIQVDIPQNDTEQEVTYTVTVTSEGGAIVETIDLIQSAAGDVGPVFSDTDFTFNSSVYSGFSISANDTKVYTYGADFPNESGVTKYIKLGASKAKGAFLFDVPSSVNQIRFFAVPWSGANPEVEITFMDASGAKISSELQSLKKGNSGATTYGSGSAVVGWNSFAANIDDYRFLYDIPANASKIQIGVSASNGVKNSRLVVFGLQIK